MKRIFNSKKLKTLHKEIFNPILCLLEVYAGLVVFSEMLEEFLQTKKNSLIYIKRQFTYTLKI